MESKRYTVNELNALLQTNRLSRVMTEAGRDKTQPETSRFYNTLQQSSILGYVPHCPTYLFHNTEDDMVPFVNSVQLQKSIAPTDTNNENNTNYSTVTFDCAPYGTHMAACVLFLKHVYQTIE